MVIALTFAAGLLVLFIGHSASTVDAAAVQLASENSGGGPIHVEHGVHTVYESNLPLPSESSPRSDGRYTVVWFSGTWCTFCAQMQSFVPSSAAKFRDRMVLVEKTVDDYSSEARHFHVQGTPTFVVLDANGREVSRFGFVANAEQFEAALAQIPAPKS